MVTEEEISALLQEHGWYLDMVRKYKTRYAYAKRRAGKQVLTRYLVTEAKFSQLTREDVLKKISS
jgi:hypothetical protein